jgi:hypothetical protein
LSQCNATSTSRRASCCQGFFNFPHSQLKLPRATTPLHGGRSYLLEWSVTLPLWHIDAVVGWGRPFHCLLNEAKSGRLLCTLVR